MQGQKHAGSLLLRPQTSQNYPRSLRRALSAQSKSIGVRTYALEPEVANSLSQKQKAATQKFEREQAGNKY